MLKPALLSSMAEFAKIPGDFAFTGVISKTPRLRCLAISFRECPAGRISSNIILSSGFSLMVYRVSFTVRRSTPATLAMRTGGISIWLRYILSFLTLRPFSMRTRATLRRSGYSWSCVFDLVPHFRSLMCISVRLGINMLFTHVHNCTQKP